MKIKATEISKDPRKFGYLNIMASIGSTEINISKRFYDNLIKLRELYTIHEAIVRKKYINRRKKDKKMNEEKIDLDELKKEGLIQDIQIMSDSLTEDGFSEEEIQEVIDDVTDDFYNKEECICLKGKNCCKCDEVLKEEELKSQPDPYAEDLLDDHSEHLMCYKCNCIRALEI